MDKVIVAKLVWGLMLIACGLGFWSINKAVTSGEIKRSSRSGITSRTIRRDQDPESFQRYVLGVAIINVFFFLAVVIWGIALFFW